MKTMTFQIDQGEKARVPISGRSRVTLLLNSASSGIYVSPETPATLSNSAFIRGAESPVSFFTDRSLTLWSSVRSAYANVTGVSVIIEEL
jgi:hypothetical protein